MVLYTIGHSNHPIGQFIHLLQDHAIERLVDVRTTPYSRFNPQFNQAALRQVLHQGGVEYVYLGTQLGGRPSDPACYKRQARPSKTSDYLNELDYAQVMVRPWFVQGVHQLLELAGERTTAMMCSEADPSKCHRHHLIASYLLSNYPDVNILHILKDGSLLDARSIPALAEDPGTNQASF